MRSYLTLVYWVLLLAVLIQLADGASIKKDKKEKKPNPKKRPRLPEGMTREDVVKRKGLKKADLEVLESLLCSITKTYAEIYDRQMEATDRCDLGYDVVYSINQATYLSNSANKKLKEKKEKKMKEKAMGKDKTRAKRYIIDFSDYPQSEWNPNEVIYYYFDDEEMLTEEEEWDRQQIIGDIHLAFNHWAEHTCLEFSLWEESSAPTTLEQYIYFTFNNTEACYGNIGRMDPSEQQQVINIANHCSPRFGTIVHEIGHAVGLYHTQARLDRDSHITVDWNNIKTYALSQYETAPLSTTHGVDYDFASSMHYPGYSNAFAINPALPVMEPQDPLYKYSMGIRTGLSFYDTKIVNIAYCSHECPDTECERGGIPDPRDCYKCKCPPGFGGTHCETVAPGTGACEPWDSKKISVTNTVYEYVQTSDYDSQLPEYPSDAQCNYLLEAPYGCQITLTFDPGFNLFCEEDICNHWVEIKYKDELLTPGPRFCCSGQPTFIDNSLELVSEGMQVSVSFDSTMKTDIQQYVYTGGFKLGYKLKDPACLQGR